MCRLNNNNRPSFLRDRVRLLRLRASFNRSFRCKPGELPNRVFLSGVKCASRSCRLVPDCHLFGELARILVLNRRQKIISSRKLHHYYYRRKPVRNTSINIYYCHYPRHGRRSMYNSQPLPPRQSLTPAYNLLTWSCSYRLQLERCQNSFQ